MSNDRRISVANGIIVIFAAIVASLFTTIGLVR
jgi:hypothetical protein